MRIFIAIAAATLSSIGASATAQIAPSATDSAATASSAPAPAKPEKKTCRMSAVIGSLVPTIKQCHTKAEWYELSRNGNARAREIMDQNRGASPPSLE